MRRLRCLLGLTLLWGAAFAGSPAGAHEELALHALPVITGVEPAVEGIEVRVLQLTAPALVLENNTDRTVSIDDHTGRPFLKIGPNGVFADANSPFTYLAFDPDGHSSMAAVLDAKGPARWTRLGRETSWTWFDPRLRYDPSDLEWSVEASHGGAPLLITGTYEPLQGHGHFSSRIDEGPRISGLDVEIVQGPVPGIFVRNETGRTLVVPGRSGEPFLRIDDRGVMANIASPSWYLGGSQSIGLVPRFAHAGAPPRWRRVSAQPVWGWLEYRAALPTDFQNRTTLGTHAADVLEWTTPLTLDGQEISLEGVVKWVPAAATAAPAAAPSSGPADSRLSLALAGAAIAVVVGNALRLRRRDAAPTEA
jgi:hypothetical protein